MTSCSQIYQTDISLFGQHKQDPIDQTVPVAQSVERWTPRGESTRPGYESPGFEARRALDVYGPPGGYGYGWWQAVARRSQ